MPNRSGGIAGIWLRARNARLGVLMMSAISLVTWIFATTVIPAPLSFLETMPLSVPVGSVAPVITVMAMGYLMIHQIPALERSSARPLALLDAGLLGMYSVILLSPAVLSAANSDPVPVVATCRVHLFALWSAVIGAHLVGTRLSVVGVTMALLIAPALLPTHLRADPPGVFVTLASGRSVEAAAIASVVVLIGVLVVATQGLPPPP